MSIQISVTVWTILCFIALMVILDRLLFRPLLSFMDKRRDKIEGARRDREAAVREREEELRRREDERISAEKQAMLEASAALEQAREDNARRIAEKKADNARRLEELRAALAGESRRIVASAEPRTAELAAAFAERLEYWRTPDGAVRNEE